MRNPKPLHICLVVLFLGPGVHVDISAEGATAGLGTVAAIPILGCIVGISRKGALASLEMLVVTVTSVGLQVLVALL